MEKRKIVFLLLLAFGVAIVISFKGPSKPVSIKDQIETPSKEKRILAEKTPQMPITEVPTPSDRLKPIPGRRLSESIADGSPDIYSEAPLTKTDSADGDSVTIYKKGRVKIKGNAGLTEFLEKPSSLEEMKDKVSVEGNLAVDF
jgi:hypothetical protein